MADITTDVSTSGKSITIESTRNNVNIGSQMKRTTLSSYKNLNINSETDSVNVIGEKCVNITTNEKSINLKATTGEINLKADENMNLLSKKGDVVLKSDREQMTIESFRNMDITSEEGNITIEAPYGTVNLRAEHNVNITPGDGGQVYVAGNFRASTISQGAASGESGLLVPTGTVVSYCGSSSPLGWFVCDGSTYNIIEFNELFNVLGYTYGGSGNSFAVPDLRGRLVLGISTGISGISNKSMGNTGGEETHALTISEMPRHSHAYERTRDGNIQAAVSLTTNDAAPAGTQAANTSFIGGLGIADAQSNGVAHNVMQPYMALNFIIKY